jgi:predicted GIY-YIG superfamily endonuclease
MRAIHFWLCDGKTLLCVHRHKQALGHTLHRRDQQSGNAHLLAQNGTVEGFTKRYGLRLLVYPEECADTHTAIQRERRLKKWPRTWKINLIRTDNPDWIDLAAKWYPEFQAENRSSGQAGR